MRLNKIRLSRDATLRVRQVKARTGLTPNVLCRLGLCLSFEDEAVPAAEHYDEHGMEFNRYTLTGELDGVMMALFRQWCHEHSVGSDGEQRDAFRAHLNRGVFMLHARATSVGELLALAADGDQATNHV